MLSIQNDGASSNREIRIKLPTYQGTHLSYLYAALSQHLNLLAAVAQPDAIHLSRQRIAENVKAHDWAAVAEVAADWYEKKSAYMAAKFARLGGLLLTADSFADELARIKKHHDAIAARAATY